MKIFNRFILCIFFNIYTGIVLAQTTDTLSVLTNDSCVFVQIGAYVKGESDICPPKTKCFVAVSFVVINNKVYYLPFDEEFRLDFVFDLYDNKAIDFFECKKISNYSFITSNDLFDNLKDKGLNKFKKWWSWKNKGYRYIRCFRVKAKYTLLPLEKNGGNNTFYIGDVLEFGNNIILINTTDKNDNAVSCKIPTIIKKRLCLF